MRLIVKVAIDVPNSVETTEEALRQALDGILVEEFCCLCFTDHYDIGNYNTVLSVEDGKFTGGGFKNGVAWSENDK